MIRSMDGRGAQRTTHENSLSVINYLLPTPLAPRASPPGAAALKVLKDLRFS
jgi:hypothetical protein